MRWSMRRSAKGLGAQASPAPPAPVPDADPAARPLPASRPAWVALPPMAQSWSVHPPLTSVPQAMATARPITYRPPRETSEGRPEPGRVVGLASVLPQSAPATGPMAPAAIPAQYRTEPPLRHAPTRPLVDHAPLTQAVDAYVGEPVAPTPVAPAPPAPTFFPTQAPPRTESTVRAVTDAGTAFQEALANLATSGHARYVEGGQTEPSPAPAKPAAQGLQAPVSPAPRIDPHEERRRDTPALTHRRNTLAQSRRLGLGAPIDSMPVPGEQAPLGETPTHRSVDPTPSTGPAEPPPTPVAAERPNAPAASGQIDSADATVSGTGRSEPGQHRSADGGTDDFGVPPRISPLAPPILVRPISDPTVRPVLRTAPLVYRATARPQLAPVEPRVIERAVITRAPQDLVQALRASHGIDVRDVEVRRDTAAGSEASRRGARAFTRGATVHLPESAGEVGATATRALLAHELVHAAQQRRLGGALPAEHTVEGRALEAEAVAAELSYGGSPELTSEDPLRHAPANVSASWVEGRITQHALDRSPPPSPLILSDPQIYEVKYAAEEVVREAIQTGQLSGSGGGYSGGSGAQDGTHGVGIGGAQSEAQFDQQMLMAINIQRTHQGLGRIASIDDLSSVDREVMHRQYTAADAANDRQRMQTELRHDLGLPPLGHTGTNSAATPGAPVVLPEHVADAALAGPSQSHARGAVPAAAGSSAAAAASMRPAGRGGREPQGVGIGGARTRDEFDAQMLMAINAQQGPHGRHYSLISELPSNDRILLDRQWTAQYAQYEQDVASYHFTQAMQEQAASHQTETSPAHAAPAASTARMASAAIAVRGHGTSAAVPATLRPNGQTETPVESLDLTKLSVQMYSRLRSQMRTELLVDRERAGLLTDFS